MEDKDLEGLVDGFFSDMASRFKEALDAVNNMSEEELKKVDAYSQMADATYQAIQKCTEKDEQLHAHEFILSCYAHQYFKQLAEECENIELFTEKVHFLVDKLVFLSAMYAPEE